MVAGCLTGWMVQAHVRRSFICGGFPRLLFVHLDVASDAVFNLNLLVCAFDQGMKSNIVRHWSIPHKEGSGRARVKFADQVMTRAIS